MQALDLLLGRVSVARLQEPAPGLAQRDVMFRAALRAPDHGLLHPWRFISIDGEGLSALGELYAKALLAREPNASEIALKKARNMPLRAPWVIAVILNPQDHPKVPLEEQELSAGCAAHALVQAAHAMSYGAIWRTGEFARDAVVNEGLGLREGEKVVGFIYVGKPVDEEPRTPEALDPDDFLSVWPAR